MSSATENMRAREEFWMSHITRLRESGKSHQEYCNECSLNIHTLRYWTRILGRAKKNKTYDQESTRTSLTEETTFASVTLTGSANSSRHEYEVILGENILKVPRGFCENEVRKLVEILS